VLPWDGYVFINPDLTIYLERSPVGEWILLESETRLGREGIGLSESQIYDERGRVGRAIQALLVTPRAAT
jgi:acyl-CoA thioesterase